MRLSSVGLYVHPCERDPLRPCSQQWPNEIIYW